MSRPIEQALTNLIPRHPGALPAELIELAGSLLAQSRNRCSNLKPEEEVARVYACANLACERLKTSLNLPPIEPRPPIPPRLYKNIYAYFDRTLTASAPRQRARANANAPASKNAKAPVKSLPQRLTPSKEKSLAGFQSQRSAKKGLLFSGKAAKDDKVPKWVAPVVRLLCREMETRRAVPHILAGVESILCLPCPGGESGAEAGVKGRVPALVAAVWFFVVVKMRGREGQGVEGVRRKEMVREVLRGARSDEGVVERVGEGDEGWVGWEEVGEKEVNAWRKEIVGKGWRDLDWWENVGEGVGVEGDGEGEEEAKELDDVRMEEAEEAVVLKRGRQKPRTMIQEQFCVTEAKRIEYQEWKEAMLSKIQELISDGHMETHAAELEAR